MNNKSSWDDAMDSEKVQQAIYIYSQLTAHASEWTELNSLPWLEVYTPQAKHALLHHLS